MGQTILAQVMNRLNSNGIPAERGYPGERIPVLEGVRAAVIMENWDQENGIATVLVSICTPASAGGALCEDNARRAAVLLRGMGGQCRQGPCRPLGNSRILCAEVFASFHGFDTGSGWTGLSVTVGGQTLSCVRAFKAWRSIGEEETLDSAKWKFQIEETLLPEASEGAALTEPFSISVVRGNRTESYSGCRLTYHRCEAGNNGLRRIRQGTAESRTVNG